MKINELFHKLNIFSFNKLLVLGAFLLTIVAIITGTYIQEGYMLEVNKVSPAKIKATRRIENSIATERNRQLALEASKRVEPLKERSVEIDEKVMGDLKSFFSTITDIRKDYMPIPNNYDDVEEVDSNSETSFDVNISSMYVEQILKMSTADYNNLQKSTTEAMENILENGIEKVNADTFFSVKALIDKKDISADAKILAYEIIILHLQPNFIENAVATEELRKSAAEKYDRVYYEEDQTIVDEGQIVKEEAYVTIEALGLMRSDYTAKIVPIIGSLLLVVQVFSLSILYIYNYNKNIINNKKETLLLFTLYGLLILISRLTVDINFYLVPIGMFTMLIALLISAKLALVLNMSVSIIVLFILKSDIQLLIYTCFTGTCIALISKFSTERNKIIIVGFIITLFNAVSSIGISLFFEKTYSTDVIINAIFAGCSGLLYVVLSVGTLPLWEAMFGIVTNLRLLELTNPNNALLRRLTIEAPGTYHHSLIVANLSETAAIEIGANPNLARVGGYFHDIGKLRYPNYFSENQVSENPHDYMDPVSSAQVIIGHISYGLELAIEYKLPKVIKDIVEQHQGSTLIKYFYIKMKNENPDTEILEEDFRYPFTSPQFKEAGIVMLADTVEAAVRSMIPSGKSLDTVEQFVRTLIKDKMEDGQLLESDLTIKDIELIIKSFMRVFKGMYHDRIAYPKMSNEGGDK